MQDRYEIAVVGAGAAGIAAAREAYDAGCRSILLVDTRSKMGGVLLQCSHDGFGAHQNGPEYIERLTENFPEEIQVMLNTAVLSVEKEKTLVLSGLETGVKKVAFEQLILAAGCLEIPMGFLSVSGTRPKGIYTAGQVQEMINICKELPKGPAVILGSGDIGLILAGLLEEKGIKVTAVVEQKKTCKGMRKNQSCIREYQIPVICSSTVAEVFGTEELKEIRIRNIQTGEEQRISCRSLLIAAGLRPNRSLIRSLEDRSQEGIGLPDWVHLCGNCNVVHSVIETVVREGKQAGKKACENVRKAGKKKDL